MAKADLPELSPIDLATELLLGKPGSDPNYNNREYLKFGSKREKAARAALADELRREAPGKYLVELIAHMIDPRSKGRVVKKQTVKFIPPRGGLQSSGWLDLKIVMFIRKQLKKKPPKITTGPRSGKRLDKVTAYEAAKHFRVSESRIRQAWKKFRLKPRKAQTNTNI